MCNVGRKQSPIAITEVTAHSRRYPRLQLASKYAYDVAVSVTQHAGSLLNHFLFFKG